MSQPQRHFALPASPGGEVTAQQTARFIMPQSRPVSAPGPSRLAAGLGLLVLTAVAAFFRLWNSAGQSLRLDEGFSIRWAAYPLRPVMHGSHVIVPSLFQIVGSDVHPPGYFLLLHFWMPVFGTSVAMLRLPSEIAGIAAVPALYLLARSLYSRSVALFAALLGALSPFWIWHAQEARMYPFLLLFTILSTYGLVSALRNGKWWGWIVYGVASVLAIYSQYYAFFILLAQALFVVGHIRHFSRRQLGIWVGVSILVGATFIPWGLVFLANYRGGTNPDLTPPSLYAPLILLSNFLFGYLTTPVTSRVTAAWPLLVPLALALGGFAGTINRRASLLWLLFLVPIAVAFLVTFVLFPFLSVRYLVVSVPALFILIAVALDRVRGRMVRIGVALLIAAVSVASWHLEETSAANPSDENYRTVIQYIQRHARPGDVVALDSFYNQDVVSYYSHFNLPVYYLPFPPGVASVKGPVNQAALGHYLNQIETGRKRLWVIYYLETNYDPTNVVRHYLAYHTMANSVIYGSPYQRNDPRYPGSFRSVQLIRYQLIPSSGSALVTRPLTMQQTRALSHLSPTLRRPFAGPYGTPGAAAPAIGHLLAPPAPHRSWQVPGASTAAASVLHILNPDAVPVRAAVTVAGAAGTMHTVMIAAHSDLDIQLGDWNAAGDDLTVKSTAPVSVTRSDRIGTRMEYINGSIAQAAARPSAAPAAHAVATPAPTATRGTPRAWILPAPASAGRLALTLTNPHAYGVFASVAPLAVPKVHYVYVPPRGSTSVSLSRLGQAYMHALVVRATASLTVTRSPGA